MTEKQQAIQQVQSSIALRANVITLLHKQIEHLKKRADVTSEYENVNDFRKEYVRQLKLLLSSVVTRQKHEKLYIKFLRQGEINAH